MTAAFGTVTTISLPKPMCCREGGYFCKYNQWMKGRYHYGNIVKADLYVPENCV